MPNPIQFNLDTIPTAPSAPPKKDMGVDLTPFKMRLQESWNRVETKTPQPAFAFTIPADQSAAFLKRFRDAAKEMGLGVGQNVSDADEAGNVVVTVVARRKKVMQPRADNGNGAGAGSLPSPPKEPATAGTTNLPGKAKK